jgi:hypothetical protein
VDRSVLRVDLHLGEDAFGERLVLVGDLIT